MPLPIEDYGIIGDTHTAALVGRDGSIDWLCIPRFDSQACFARLLGDDGNGYWRLAPAGPVRGTRRRYRGDSLVLETEFDTDDGTVRVVDCMPVREEHPEVTRLVEGVSGRVQMRMDLVIRFDYGRIMPWVHRVDGRLVATAGPVAVSLWTPLHTRGEKFTTVADFSIHEGQRVPFMFTAYPSHESPPRPSDAHYVVQETEQYWQEWADACQYEGEWADAVGRSLLTLKALTYRPTGGIVAAATTSLPEQLGGIRNWDYRYCWLRDATLTLDSLMVAGYQEEAESWRDWLLRAVAGDPADLQIMYGPAGERRLDEYEVDWLGGYEGASPVRVGNAASDQYQLDVYGEVMDALYLARERDIDPVPAAWDLQLKLMEFLESGWREPDDGIWEMRGPRRHFTHSKVMAWVAMDRAVKSVERFGVPGPVDRWRALRQEIRDEVLAKGYNADISAFTQYYGGSELDAGVLMMPLVGFLPATDPRMTATIDAISRRLVVDGLVLRYRAESASHIDGLSGSEGAFLSCSFWLAEDLALSGRRDEGRALFERLLGLANDLGLLAEEYDTKAGRMVGNFPQAFSHMSLVSAAQCLSGRESRGALRATDPARRSQPAPGARHRPR